MTRKIEGIIKLINFDIDLDLATTWPCLGHIIFMTLPLTDFDFDKGRKEMEEVKAKFGLG